MGGVTDAIFGGSEQESKPVQTDKMTDEQLDLLKKLSEQISGQVGEGVEPYPGHTVADMSDLEKSMQQYGQQYGENVLPTMQKQGMGLLEGQEWEPGRVEDMWQKSVFDPARQQFETEIMPAMMEKYAGAGSLDSSALNRAMAKSATDLQTQTQSQLSDLMFKSWQDYQDRNLQRQQLGRSLLGQTLQSTQRLQQMGQVPREAEQARLQEQASKWMFGQPYQNPWLRMLKSGPLSVYPYGTGQESKGSSSGGIGGVLQGAGTMMLGM